MEIPDGPGPYKLTGNTGTLVIWPQKSTIVNFMINAVTCTALGCYCGKCLRLKK